MMLTVTAIVEATLLQNISRSFRRYNVPGRTILWYQYVPTAHTSQSGSSNLPYKP